MAEGRLSQSTSADSSSSLVRSVGSTLVGGRRRHGVSRRPAHRAPLTSSPRRWKQRHQFQTISRAVSHPKAATRVCWERRGFGARCPPRPTASLEICQKGGCAASASPLLSRSASSRRLAIGCQYRPLPRMTRATLAMGQPTSVLYGGRSLQLGWQVRVLQGARSGVGIIPQARSSGAMVGQTLMHRRPAAPRR
jgi:hypothetical protein